MPDNVIITTEPSTLVRLKNIRPAFNPIIFGFNSIGIGVGPTANGIINFSSVLGGGTDYVCADGDYIEVNGQRFYFRDAPKYGDLDTSYTRQQQTKGTWQQRDRMNKVRKKLRWPLFKDV